MADENLEQKQLIQLKSLILLSQSIVDRNYVDSGKQTALAAYDLIDRLGESLTKKDAKIARLTKQLAEAQATVSAVKKEQKYFDDAVKEVDARIAAEKP